MITHILCEHIETHIYKFYMYSFTITYAKHQRLNTLERSKIHVDCLVNDRS